MARGEAGLEGARKEIEALGRPVLVFPLDVADDAALYAAADRIVERWHGIDLWINCAMATVVGPVARLSAAEIRRVTDVTYLGAVHGTLAALRHMRRRGGGTIVQIGSALAYRPIPLQAPYCGAKHALRGFTDGLRTELIHDRSRIRLTMVHLPGVNTPQFDWATTHFATRHQPVGTVFEPQGIASAIIDAAERGAREVWIGWPAIQAILGSFAFPGWLDRYLAHAAYRPQLSSDPVPPGMSGNLFAPHPGDHGARGRFGARARKHVIAVDASKVRAGVCVLVAGVVLVGLLVRGPAVGLRRLGR